MERFVGVTSVLLFCALISAPTNTLVILSRLCKFCDTEPTVCNATGVCESECSVTSICSSPDEVCASAWRRNGGNTTLETVCHDPALAFHGQHLTDYNSSECLMERVKEDFYMCSCNAEECNDLLVFSRDSPTTPEPSDPPPNYFCL